MNQSKEYIQTSRFKINPHHSSGTLIIIEDIPRGVESGNAPVAEGEPTKPPRGVKIFTTESVEYYKALHRKMKKNEETSIFQGSAHTAPTGRRTENRRTPLCGGTFGYTPSGVHTENRRTGDRRDGLRNNNTLEINGILLDNYVEFIRKK